MTAEALDPQPVPDAFAGPGGTFWEVVSRDERGYPTELRRVHDVAVVRNPDGTVMGYSVGCHPSRMRHPLDLVYKPEAPPSSHHCAMLAGLDCYAAAGDPTAAALARFHAAHPDGPQTPEDYAEEAALRAGFERRR